MGWGEGKRARRDAGPTRTQRGLQISPKIRLFVEFIGGWILMVGLVAFSGHFEVVGCWFLAIALLPFWVGRIIWLMGIHPIFGIPLGSFIGLVAGGTIAFLGGAWIGLFTGALSGAIAASIKVGWKVPSETD